MTGCGCSRRELAVSGRGRSQRKRAERERAERERA